ncbi:transcriptional regulator [Pseudomonas sp. GM78]|nr:transcriptional regulator [Pseudomonas sp. GM78]
MEADGKDHTVPWPEDRAHLKSITCMVNENKRIQSVERAMAILEAIAAAGGEARLVDLVDGLGLHKSTLHGLLNTLAALGYVSRQGASYALGLRLREIAQPLNDADAVIKGAFAPALSALAELTGENCYLAVPCGTRKYVYIDVLEHGDRGLAKAARGKREGLTTSAIGKIFLALDRDLARSLRKAGLLTPDLEQDLGLIVEQGYALDLEQAEPGLNCMALPLRKQGRLVASLSVAGPVSRLPEAKLVALAGQVMRDMYDMVKL